VFSCRRFLDIIYLTYVFKKTEKKYLSDLGNTLHQMHLLKLFLSILIILVSVNAKLLWIDFCLQMNG